MPTHLPFSHPQLTVKFKYNDFTLIGNNIQGLHHENKTVQRTWIREDTLTMLLAIPLVLCIIYMKNDKYTMVQVMYMYMYCAHTLPIANAKLVDLHQQTGDI